MFSIYRKTHGLTLIEVLIALAILSIALIAIIKVSSQNLRDTTYLNNKTIATYVALESINKVRAGLIQFDNGPPESETIMLGQKWAWTAKSDPTPNSHIHKISVTVANAVDHKKLITLVSYIYAE